uniref:Protein-arginine deiminase n=1 Tax=Electrophorus electricus TaxID=8005 RepID=A0AAY5EFJ4_ELEEL
MYCLCVLQLSVRFYGNKSELLGNAVLHLTAVEISLDIDADRDGIVERNNPNKASWKWGPNGHGAILLVNCDCESTFRKELDSEDEEITRVSDLKDMSKMILRTRGPAVLPEGYKLSLHISRSHAESVRLFQKDYPLVLNKEQLAGEVPYVGGDSQQELFVEGIRFPDKDFDGLITINLSLLEPSGQGFPETPIYTDKVMFRVAPWIMTPNTLKPVEVFVCSTSDNYDFLKAIKSLVQSSGYKLKICHEYMNRGDRWMQDEIEFGYIDSPHQRIPVVLDSPRDRELEDFPYDVLLGPDFGYVTRYPVNERVSSLDSFGNLEVSPPVTVNGKKYPLGRIIIGVAFPTTAHGRNMTKVIQDFLWAQKVQEPIALYSDWLVVGHVDEFMTFVPAPDRKGFRLLLASPDAGYKLFRSLQVKGHGSVNMLVLGKNLGIPKPFGPQVRGTCALEAEMRSLLEPLGLNCTFIDDFASYHKLLGEVHCGSNVRREPFEFRWWNLE